MIVVKRNKKWIARFVPFNIFIDNHIYKSIKAGQEIEINLPEGLHEIHIQYGKNQYYMESTRISFKEDGSTKTFLCGMDGKQTITSFTSTLWLQDITSRDERGSSEIKAKNQISFIKFFDEHVFPEMENIKTGTVKMWNEINKKYPECSQILDNNDQDLNYAVAALITPIFRSCWGPVEQSVAMIVFNRKLEKNSKEKGLVFSHDIFDICWEVKSYEDDIVDSVIRNLTLRKIKATDEYMEYVDEARNKLNINDFDEFISNSTDEDKKEYFKYLAKNKPKGLIDPNSIRSIYNLIIIRLTEHYNEVGKRISNKIKRYNFDPTLHNPEDFEFMKNN